MGNGNNKEDKIEEKLEEKKKTNHVYKNKYRKNSNNTYGISYAHPGICTLCLSEVATFNSRCTDGKYETCGNSSNFIEKTVLLSNKSEMKINMCKECLDRITPDDFKDIMASEIAGWESEAKTLVRNGKWTQERADAYINRCKDLKIVEFVK